MIIRCNQKNCKHSADFSYKINVVRLDYIPRQKTLFICSDCAVDKGYLSKYGVITPYGQDHNLTDIKRTTEC